MFGAAAGAAGVEAAAVGAAGVSAGAGFLVLEATQASKSAWLTTCTSIGMKAWSMPHSSRHWP